MPYQDEKVKNKNALNARADQDLDRRLSEIKKEVDYQRNVITQVAHQGAVQEEQIKNIFKTQLEHALTLKEILIEIKGLALCLKTGRPSWTVSILFTVMGAALVGLATYLITRGIGGP